MPMRDVFYYGTKPNVHPRERFAENLADARSQCTTEHFWIINEFCDYRNFDWDFDFDFLPDEDVWAEDHNNVWPSQHQKDSGTWLCSENHSDIIVHRTDVDPVPRKNEKNDHWVELDLIDTSKFDFSWHPDPNEPPYIYRWGTRHFPVEMYPVLEYRVPDATQIKYMGVAIELTSSTEVIQKTIGTLELIPQWDRWKIFAEVDKSKFDFNWRPDPREPPLIYVWGNKYEPAEVKSTLEYHVPGATEYKYMGDDIALYNSGGVELLPQWDRWKIFSEVDKSKFDFSWRPDPREPAFIYVWGNKYEPAELKPTLEYHCEDATERKYMNEPVEVLPEWDRWNIIIPVDQTSFDFSWRPDPTSPPYIYVFGNQWHDSVTEPTLEYHVPGATDRKYVSDIIPNVTKTQENWKTVIPVESFDYSWRPNPHSPPQIYQWADNGPRYTMPGATEVVLMEYTDKTKKTTVNRYQIRTTLSDLVDEHPDEVFWATNPDLIYDKFDFSWRPDEHNFRHINVFGNEYSKDTHTYYVNGPLFKMGYREYNYVDQLIEIDSNLSMFFIDRSNPESKERYNQLKERYPQLQKTRYLNSWVETINRCIAKSDTRLFWVLNSELDYSQFEFDFYPSPWQEKMVHVFGTQWSHWGTTFLVNKEQFPEDTKYVKVIEHLNMLNFAKNKRAIARDCLYPIYMIDHGNELIDNINGIPVTHIKYEHSYLRTFRNLLEILPVKKEHYVWVCSSICDYGDFDFSYICDPFAKDQLHVFPSDSQMFGDTFLIDVNKLRNLIEEMAMLEDYEKVNYNPHQRVKRLPPPVIITEGDSHVSSIQTTFNWPYAVFVTEDNKDLQVTDIDPISLWAPETKNILVTSTGASRIIVPREAQEFVNDELYDYPYIGHSRVLTKSRPLDIVYLSNGEEGAEENWEHLLKITKELKNRVVRVEGVSGRVAAYHAAAEASETPWAFTVFAKLRVNPEFDWNWQPDRMQIPKHYIFYAENPVNGLVYGHQAMIAYNKRLALANKGRGLDFTLDDEHEVVQAISGTANYNTDPFSTWRTAFREVIKLKDECSNTSQDRIIIWLTKATGDFADYSLKGAQDAVDYYDEVKGEFDKLKLSYEWNWLQEKFNKLNP